MAEDASRRRRRLTPDGGEERFPSVPDESALRLAVDGPSGDAPVDVNQLTEAQLIEVWEDTVAGVKDGTIPTFADKQAFIDDVLRRLNR